MTDPFAKLAWLALRAVPGIGVVLFQRLVDTFGNPEAVFEASPTQLTAVRGITPALARAILDFKDWPRLDRELEQLAALGGQLITRDDPDFPEALRQIPYPPPFLYLKGSLTPNDRLAVALVGTRKPTHYGRKISYRLGRDLSLKGITVVSGLARGIDTAAHRAVVENGGRTFAVLGCGLDVVYPPENRELYNSIPAHGALISEYPLGTPPEARNFPVRNRLISGLALGVVVVEAASQSGAHITARYALEQGREVFAVPGPIDSPTSVGPHHWIKQGARLVESVADILSDVRLQPKAQDTLLFHPESVAPVVEDPVIAHFQADPVHMEELILATGLPAAEVLGRLTMLELQGLIKELPGKLFVLAE